MEYQLTPRQLAQATGVSESSIKRWCDAGEIATIRTPGGHRRIPLSGAMQFLRGTEYELLEPEVLGLPASLRKGAPKLDEAQVQLGEVLESGDADAARRILFELYLSRRPMSEIGDHVIAPAFARIGQRWQCGELEVFQERRAFEIMRNLLHELRLSQAVPPPGALTALGGTPSGDSYALAPILVELVLRERGWRACYIGSNLPIETLVSAVRDQRPRLFWLSISHIPDEAQFLEDFAQLEQVAYPQTALVVGGQALRADLRSRIRYAAHLETLAHLDTFAATMEHASHSPPKL